MTVVNDSTFLNFYRVRKEAGKLNGNSILNMDFAWTIMRKLTLDKDLLVQMDTLTAMNTALDTDTFEEEDTGTCKTIVDELKTSLEMVADGCVESHVFVDIEMFDPWSKAKDSDEGSNSNKTFATVSSVLTRNTRLQGGCATLEHILRNPTSDTKTLTVRQKSLRILGSNPGLMYELRTSLDKASKLEQDVMWAFRTPGEEAQALYDMVYFQSWFLKGLNASPGCLTAYAVQRIIVSPLIGAITPILYVIVPYMILRYNGLRLGFVAYVRMLYLSFTIAGSMMTSGFSGGPWIQYLSIAFTVIFYFQSLFTSFQVSATLTKVCRIITNKMQNVHDFLKISCSMRRSTVIAGLDVASAWSSSHIFKEDFSGEALSCFTVFGNFGRALKAYNIFDSVGNGQITQWAYLMDAVLAIEETRLRDDFCFTMFSESKTPVFEADGICHPCLVGEVTRNDVKLGQINGTNNMILTGPNAGGKSTILKSILIAALLSQSVTIAPCTKFLHTPFRLIQSQINVPDCKGSQSLFEAEMFRCKNSLDKLRTLDAGSRNSLVVMDEIFSSTNVVEGIAGAYAVAKALAALPHNIAVISTHFVYLCKLAKDTKKYINKKMQVDILPGGAIQYPYIMADGISKQFVALELLKHNGFDASIIDDAIEVRRRLTRS